MQKIESIDEASDFDCYCKSDGKLVLVDVDKELKADKPTQGIVLQSNISDEK